jgi:hypothetical protein
VRLGARLGGVVVAGLLAGSVVAYQQQRQERSHTPYSRFELPGYDAHVYMAMAEHPAFFTVAPWGYRALTPWVVHVLPVPKPTRGFRYVNLAGLASAAFLIYLFLRRLGFGEWVALLGLLAFCASGAVAETLYYAYLAEPLTVALFAAFLLAVECGASLPILCLLMALGCFSKELFLVLVPLVFLESWRRVGTLPSLGRAALVLLPGVVVSWLLRGYWAPYLETEASSPGLDAVPQALAAIAVTWRGWWWPLLQGGVLPLGVIGMLHRGSRPYLARYGYLVVAMTSLPFAAGVYTGQSEIAHFFTGDVRRLMIYALPTWIPLALMALEPLVRRAPVPPSPVPPALTRLALVAGLVFLVWVPTALDPYRRVDLRGSRDGPLVLGLVRESLRTATRLESGQDVSFTPAANRYSWGVSDPGELRHLRWFLRAGWGPLPHYGLDRIQMQAGRASLLLPCLAPRDLEVALWLESELPQRLRVFVNGREVGEALAGSGRETWRVQVSRDLLFRGDNLLELVSQGALQAAIYLERLEYRPVHGS